MPKVSVIIPVYNVEPFLREALDSVIGQTLKDIEIICVDDCSTDGSLDVLREYEQKDSRIKVIAQEINQGEVVAKYTGAQIAQAEYIATLDPDDYYAQNYCEILYNTAIENNVDIACCNIQHIRENGRITKGRILRVTRKNKLVDFGTKYIEKINPATTNKIMKKEIYLTSLNFIERDIWKDFYQYWRGYTVKDYKIYLVNKALYFYRQRKSSITHQGSSNEGKWKTLLKTIDMTLKYLIENGRYEQYRSIFWLGIAEKMQKIYKKKKDYQKALLEVSEIVEKHSISQSDIDILKTNRIIIYLFRKLKQFI